MYGVHTHLRVCQLRIGLTRLNATFSKENACINDIIASGLWLRGLVIIQIGKMIIHILSIPYFDRIQQKICAH